jgi:hypothetical protein
MKMEAPPTFDAMAFPPPPPIDAVAPPPRPAMMVMAPPAASAPSFESLMVDGEHSQQQQQLQGVQPMPPPPPAIDDDILAALDPAEREALLEEQRQIMQHIEKQKANDEASSAAAKAMAFDQRSSAAVANVAASMDFPGSATGTNNTMMRSSPVRQPTRTHTTTTTTSSNTVDLGHGERVPLHGQEKTLQAIKDGCAVIVQCMSCSNWMQVTGGASLMLCPICGTVCPVDKAGAATSADMEAAAQMAADAKLAEELQKEEYKKAGGSSSGGQRRQQQQQRSRQSQEQDQSWYDWLVGTPAPAPAAPIRGSAELPSRQSRPSPRLVAATTGDETQGLIRPAGARVAPQQTSMFACVADSVTAAAEQMTAYTLPSDQEGNVHGVDSSSLLAMPDVSRQREM